MNEYLVRVAAVEFVARGCDEYLALVKSGVFAGSPKLLEYAQIPFNSEGSRKTNADMWVYSVELNGNRAIATIERR